MQASNSRKEKELFKERKVQRSYIVLKGWLIKQGGTIKTFKTRLFTLNTAGELAYFKTDMVRNSLSFYFFFSRFKINIFFFFFSRIRFQSMFYYVVIFCQCVYAQRIHINEDLHLK